MIEPLTSIPVRSEGRRRWVALGLAFLAVFILGPRVAESGDLADVKARGRLVLLVHPTQDSPFVAANLDAMREQDLKLVELTRPEQFKGVEIELLQGFAKSLGVGLGVRVLVEGYDALLPALLRREGDFAASQLSITPKRLEMVDFSAPYLSDWLAVVVREDSKITKLSDLSGKRAAVIDGSSHLEFLRAASPGVILSLTSFDLESLEAVEHHQADFTLIETGAPVGGRLDSLHPHLKVALRLQEVGTGIAVRKGSDLLEPLDKYLSALKKSGELQKILDRHGVRGAVQ
ncbi:MAG TPA: transporter substrate-binding domain-containing protein [Thermoanaerobaculia bacterium]|jgi:ABC-type amino acid transport substrate-binding protein|nr:transporter substrate-binding domain-containing protein [Thermoanaerobaculia bacterium]